MKKILFMLLLMSVGTYAQEPQMTIHHGAENEDLQLILDFENIGINELEFSGKDLENKYFVLRLKEFINGEETNTAILFDERGNDYFKIDTTFTSFKFLSKIGSDELKLWIRGNGFGSKQSFFKIDQKNGSYVVKDFLGRKRSVDISTQEPFYIFAVITPNRNPDGSGSYCQVAQSEIAPEEFGKEFKIPHYFLVEMEFIEEAVSLNSESGEFEE